MRVIIYEEDGVWKAEECEEGDYFPDDQEFVWILYYKYLSYNVYSCCETEESIDIKICGSRERLKKLFDFLRDNMNTKQDYYYSDYQDLTFEGEDYRLLTFNENRQFKGLHIVGCPIEARCGQVV